MLFFVACSAKKGPAFDHYSAGVEKYELKDFDAAIEQFDKAISLSDRGEPSFYYMRASARARNGDFQGALGDFDRTIEIEPKAHNYFLRGSIKSRINDLPGSIDDYNKAIELEPSNFKYHKFAALQKIKNRDMRGAAIDLDNVVKLKPEPEHHIILGKVAHETGDSEDAIAAFDRAIALKPDLAEPYFLRGIVKGESGDEAGAASDLEAAAKLAPGGDLYDNYTGLALWKYQGGNAESAIIYATEAISIKPSEYSAYEIRAASYKATGNIEGFEQDRKEANRLKLIGTYH